MKSVAFLPLALMVVGCAVGTGEEVGEDESALVPGEYAVLGDSYSAGLGTREYVDDACKRSNYAFGPKIAAARGYVLKHVACSGARVRDVSANQLGALSSATTLVTISVGGNDAGFADVITQCAKPWPWTCWGNIDNAKAFIRNQLPGLLDGLYNDIRARAPKAKVVVVGYPRIFNGEECNALARISPGEQTELNNTANLLSDTIANVARAHGFTYADPRPRFTGHAICDDVEWVNGLSNPISESYHPNRTGHDGFAALITSLL